MVNVIVTDIDGLKLFKEALSLFLKFLILKKNCYDKVIIFLYDDNFIPVLLLTWSAQNALRNLKILYSTANII